MFSLMLRNLASVQLRCLQAIKTNAIGIPIPQETDAAITWLQTALQQHWNGTLYLSLMPPPPGYDANIDIVSACIYGPCRVLTRSCWRPRRRFGINTQAVPLDQLSTTDLDLRGSPARINSRPTMRVLSTADLHFHVNRSDGETSAFSSASTSRSPRLRDSII
jgi:hypothetical protein